MINRPEDKNEDSEIDIEYSECRKNMIEGEIRLNKQIEYSLCVYGNSGQGKSTLCCALDGRNLIAKANSDGDLALENGEKTPREPLISLNPYTSQTQHPVEVNKFKLEDHEMTLYDLPGTNDTRGYYREIENGYYTFRLMENMRYIKIIFVAAWESLLATKGNEFVDSLINFSGMFKDINQFEQSIAFVITKVNTARQNL